MLKTPFEAITNKAHLIDFMAVLAEGECQLRSAERYAYDATICLTHGFLPYLRLSAYGLGAIHSRESSL
jgi:hypothetical protein